MIKDFYVATQNSESALKDKKTLSRQRIFMSRQTQHKVEVNSFATKTSIVETKDEKNYKKNVGTQKLMSRHNEELKAEISVATKENYVATENGREVKKAKTILSRQRFQCCNKQFSQRQRSKKEICRDIFRVCCDTEFNLLAVQDNKTMSRQRKGLLRQQQHAIVRNSIVTKVEKNPRKNAVT